MWSSSHHQSCTGLELDEDVTGDAAGMSVLLRCGTYWMTAAGPTACRIITSNADDHDDDDEADDVSAADASSKQHDDDAEDASRRSSHGGASTSRSTARPVQVSLTAVCKM